jgi:hypothetical protein
MRNARGDVLALTAADACGGCGFLAHLKPFLSISTPP